MKSKLVRRLTTSIAGLLLVYTLLAGLLMGFLLWQNTLNTARNELEQEAQRIAEVLSSIDWQSSQTSTTGSGHYGSNPEHESSGMHQGQLKGYGSFLKLLEQVTPAQIWVVDSSGQMDIPNHLETVSVADLPEHAKSLVQQVLEGKTGWSQDFSSLLEAPSLSVGAPVLQNGEVIGAVLLHEPVSLIQNVLYWTLLSAGGALLLSLLFSLAAAWRLSVHLSAPLRKMEQAAGQIAKGDYSVRIAGIKSKQDNKHQTNQIPGQNKNSNEKNHVPANTIHQNPEVSQEMEQDEIVRLAQTLNQLAASLEQHEKERSLQEQKKREFSANVSHELRTPAAVIKNSLEMMQEELDECDGDTISALQESITTLLAESRHLERLVNDMLELSRLQDETFPLHFEEVDLQAVCRDAVRAARIAGKNTGVSLETQFMDEDFCIQGDYGRLRQLVLILLNNAYRFSNSGQTVELHLFKDLNPENKKESFHLEIIDHGSGIPQEQLPHIFERFHSTHSPVSAASTGTGLGLPIAKEITGRHHGQISVSSENEKTVFRIDFPADPGESF